MIDPPLCNGDVELSRYLFILQHTANNNEDDDGDYLNSVIEGRDEIPTQLNIIQ